MKNLLLLLFTTLSIGTLFAQTNFTCPEDGLFEYSTCHSSYYHCYNNGESYLMTCPPGQVFNKETGHCDYSENVPSCSALLEALAPPTASFTCPDDGYGYHASSPCSPYFYFCQDGVAVLAQCPPGFAFNSDTGKCVKFDSMSACDNVLTLGEIPPPTGGLFLFADCHQIYWNVDGVNGNANEQWCPAGYVFNWEKNYCDMPDQVSDCQ